MEIRHLRYFQAVAREGGFLSASNFMRVAQSALSRQIKDLEVELGVELLKRTTRGVELTREGKHFLKEVDSILLKVESAVINTRLLKSGAHALFRLGVFGSIQQSPAYDFVVSLKKERPDLLIEVFQGSFGEKHVALHAGLIDVAFFQKPYATELDHSLFHERDEVLDEVYVAVAPGDALAESASDTLEISQIKGRRLIIENLINRDAHRVILNELHTRYGFEIENRIEVPNVAIGYSLLEADRSILVLSRSMARWTTNGVRTFRLRDVDLVYRFGVVVSKREQSAFSLDRDSLIDHALEETKLGKA